MPKIYRTMQGESVDIEALFRKHELAQAVGNMQANARGDELGPGGTVVKTREQKAREYYQRQKAAKQAVDSAHNTQRIVPQPEDPAPIPELDASVAPKEIKTDKSKPVKKQDKLIDDLDGTEGI